MAFSLSTLPLLPGSWGCPEASFVCPKCYFGGKFSRTEDFQVLVSSFPSFLLSPDIYGTFIAGCCSAVPSTRNKSELPHLLEFVFL